MPELPQAREVETAVLGCVILDHRALEWLGTLAPEDFYWPSNRLVFRALLDLTGPDHATPIDVVTLAQLLTERGELQKVGGVPYLASLTDGVPFPDPTILGSYVKILKRKAYQRELINLADNAKARALAADAEPVDIAAGLVADLASLNGNKPGSEAREAAARITGECPTVPAGAFHPLVALYCDLIGPTTEAPDSFHAACFLTLLGSALGPAVHTMQSEPLWPIFFTVLVGTAGDPRKGTAIAKACRLMFAANGRESIEVIRSLDSAEGFIRRVAKCQGIEGLPNGRPGGAPFKPVLFRISEYRSLISKANRENQGNLTPKLCEAYDRDALEVATSTNPAYVPEPYISFVAGTSKAYMRELKSLDIEGGLGSRTLFIPGTPKPRIPSPPPPAEPEYSSLVKKLLDVITFWRTEAGEGSISINLDADAGELWRPFYVELPRRVGDDALMTALVARFHHHTLKIALLYAALDYSRRISVKHLAPAIAFADYLLAALYYIFSEFGLPPWVELERKIIQRVRDAGEAGIPRRRLQQAFWRYGSEEFQRRMKALTAPNSELVERDRGRQKWVFLAD